MRLRSFLTLALLLACPSRARADDPPTPPAAPPDAPPAPPAKPPAEAPDPGEDLYKKAVEQQERAQYTAAKKTFKKLIEQFPQSKYVEEAEDRSASNAFLGFTQVRYGGPPDRRIDVALMGDGYPLEDQKRFNDAAEGEMKLLFGERLYDEYESYFNIYRFNLASLDKGVDQPGAGPGPGGVDPTNKKAYKKHIREYSTALDCKAAGPQGQVMADPGRVNHYLQYLKVNDGLTIAFAQMGQLGMGGGGIATTGPRGVVVHEFGHAFLCLLDEYANNPGPPAGQFSAPNATTDPDPKKVPWKHFLDAKVPGVDILEGGATFVKGVWRPAASCAMNSGGGSPYCPVCREAGVLMIYNYVSPIDEALPAGKTAKVGPGQASEVSVVPMRPKNHELEVEWFARSIRVVTSSKPKEERPAGALDPEIDPLGIGMDTRQEHHGAWRGGERLADGPRTPLRGEQLKDLHKKEKGGPTRHAPDLSGLKPGRYLLTAVVRDTAVIPGDQFPWVLKDPYGLLEERREWTLDVMAAALPGGSPAPPTPPAMDR